MKKVQAICDRCGKQGHLRTIRAFHNQNCRNLAVVALNIETGEKLFFRWLHHVDLPGITDKYIRDILSGQKKSTRGFVFRQARQEEVAAGAVLFPIEYHRNARRKAVIRIAGDGTETRFERLKDAVKATPGAEPSKIGWAATGLRLTHAGYRWRFP